MATTTEHRKQPESNGIERRYLADGIEFRDADKQVIRGYYAKFGVVYDMGWFTEELDRRALDNADTTDVRILKNHDPNWLYGRTTAGTARVGVDNIGPWYEFDYDPTDPDHVAIKCKIDKREITQSSWGFYLRSSKDGNGDRWEKRDGKEHRVLTDVRAVLDASMVTFPANPDTTVAKRSLEAFNEAQTPPGESRHSDTQLIEIELERALLERRMFQP